MYQIPRLPAEPRRYGDQELRKLRKELSPIQEKILKEVYRHPTMAPYTVYLENRILDQDANLKIPDVKIAIKILEEKKLLSTDVGNGAVTSITTDGIYLFLLTDIKRSETNSEL